tara:strand:- start:5580 stop:6395 length:816 start_codon:yes stop_codon:yes gene_type:complete
MNNLNIYCITLNPNHLTMIKELNYLPVGLGNSDFSEEWLSDKNNNTIHHKNDFYGEYTFHYWLWKNNSIKFNGWIGFCQYRKFWKKNNTNMQAENFINLNNSVLKKIPDHLLGFESILGENFYVNDFRLSKFIKHNLKVMIADPSLFFNKNKRTIKFHFDMMHGHGNLDKAIELMPNSEKEDFRHFVNTEVSFNPHNMFICKNKEILFSYYDSLFPWLANCEKLFGFDDLKGYGMKRIYGFLAERYCSYWFKKYTKFSILPIQFKDISDFL